MYTGKFIFKTGTVYILSAALKMQKRKRSDSVVRHAKRFKNRFGKLDKRLVQLENLVGMGEVKKKRHGAT